MGRLARGVVRAARGDERYLVTLLADSPRDARALRSEFGNVDVRATATARRAGRYDVAWFPFNGMRYSVAVPAVVSINDTFAFSEPHRDRFARFREQAPIRRAARDATLAITISAWSKAEIVRELDVPPDRIEIVRPEPDPFWFPGTGDILPEPFRSSRFALVVGASEPRKNVRLAIDACARAFDGPAELLAIVGHVNGDDRAYARASGVRAGEIVASDVLLRALYRRATVVLVPSFAEGFGLVAVEAMACGAAVLAANASALPEATAGAATLLDPHDPGGWARAIRDLYDDETRANAARAIARARFAATDRDAPARRVLELVGAVARRRSHA